MCLVVELQQPGEVKKSEQTNETSEYDKYSKETTGSDGVIKPKNAIVLVPREIILPILCQGSNAKTDAFIAENATDGACLAKFGRTKQALEYIEQQMVLGVVETTQKNGKIKYAVRNVSAGAPLNTPKEMPSGNMEKIIAFEGWGFFRARKDATDYMKKLQEARGEGKKEDAADVEREEKDAPVADAGKKS